MSDRTVFQEIWDGKIPSYDIFKSERHGLLAMLDISPATRGHVLVITKERVSDWQDLPKRRLLQATILGTLVAARIQSTLNPIRVNRVTSGYGVNHFHDHYLPSYVRGDSATVFDPERIEHTEDPKELRAVQDILRFPPELCDQANEELQLPDL